MSPGSAPMWVLTCGTPSSVASPSTSTYPHQTRSPPTPHDRHRPCAAPTTRGSSERWADPETRVLVVSGTRIRPVDGRVDWVSPADAPDGAAGAARRAGRAGLVRASIVDAGGRRRRRSGRAGRRCAGCCPTSPTTRSPGAAGLPRARAGRVAVRHPLLPALRRAAGAAAAGARAGLRELRHSAVPAHRPGGDHGRHVAASRARTTSAACSAGSRSWPEGRYSTLAGFCEPGETLEDAVRREVAEEVGSRSARWTYFGNQPWPLPASLMLGFVARARRRRLTVDGARSRTPAGSPATR